MMTTTDNARANAGLAESWARRIRLLLALLGSGSLLLAAGYFWQMPWATATWPWPDGRLSYIFVASIIAAIGTAQLWMARTGELRALAAGSLALMVMMSGSAAYLRGQAWLQGRTELLPYGTGAALAAVVSITIFLWSRSYPVLDSRPAPRFLLASYVLFVVILVGVAVALFARLPTAFPWRLNPDTAVLFAWIYLGNAFYFLYAFTARRWHNAAVQLWSFLAYNLVLIGPLAGHLARVEAALQPALVVYLGVLVYSSLVAVYYLFVQRVTRVGRNKGAASD
jgi:hypothetical protein